MRPEDVHIRYIITAIDRGTRGALASMRSVRSESGATARAVHSDSVRQSRDHDMVSRSVRSASSDVRRWSADVARALGRNRRTLGDDQTRWSRWSNAGRSAIGGMVGGLQSLNRHLLGVNFHAERFRMALRLMMIPGLLAFLGAAAQAIGTLAGGAIALVAAIRPAVGILGALPGVAIGAAQAFGVLMGSISPVAQAIQQYTLAQKAAFGQDQKNASAAKDNAETMRQAHEAVAEAERGLTDAHRQEKFAQEDLTQARKEATQQIRDLQYAAEDAALAERRANLSLIEARRELARMEKDPTVSGLELRSQRLAVAEAEQQRIEAERDARIARQDAAQARRKGVEGDPQVIAARRALADATRGVADAERGLQDAQHGVATAQRNIKETTDQASSSLNNFRYYLKQLSPAGREFVHFVTREVIPELRNLQQVGQENLLPGVEAGARSAMRNLPVVRRIVAGTARVFGNLARRAGNFLGSDAFGSDLAQVAETNQKAMGRLGRAGIQVFRAFVDIAHEARPLVTWLSKLISGWMRTWAETIKTKRRTGELRTEFNQAHRTLDKLIGLFSDLWHTLGDVMDAAKPLGNQILNAITRNADEMERWTSSAKGAKDMRDWFNQLRGPLFEAGRLTADLFTTMTDLAGGGGLKQMIRVFRTDVLPSFARLTEEWGRTFGPELVRLIGSALDLMSELGGPLQSFVSLIAQAAQAFTNLLRSPIGGPIEFMLKALISGVLIARTVNFLKDITGAGRATSILGRTWQGVSGFIAESRRQVALYTDQVAAASDMGAANAAIITGGAVAATAGGVGRTPLPGPAAPGSPAGTTTTGSGLILPTPIKGAGTTIAKDEVEQLAENTARTASRSFSSRFSKLLPGSLGRAFEGPGIKAKFGSALGTVGEKAAPLARKALGGSIAVAMFAGFAGTVKRHDLSTDNDMQEWARDGAIGLGRTLGINLGETTGEEFARQMHETFRALSKGRLARVGDQIATSPGIDVREIMRGVQRMFKGKHVDMDILDLIPPEAFDLHHGSVRERMIKLAPEFAREFTGPLREKVTPEFWHTLLGDPKALHAAQAVNQATNQMGRLFAQTHVTLPPDWIRTDPKAAEKFAKNFRRAIKDLRSGLLRDWGDIHKVMKRGMGEIRSNPEMNGQRAKNAMATNLRESAHAWKRLMNERPALETKEGLARVRRLINRAKILEGKDPLDVEKRFRDTWTDAGHITKDGVDKIIGHLKDLSPQARDESGKAIIQVAREMARNNHLPEGEVENLVSKLVAQFGRFRDRSDEQTKKGGEDVVKNVGRMVGASTRALDVLGLNVNSILKSFNADKVSYDLKKFVVPFNARGGYPFGRPANYAFGGVVGAWGERGPDDQLAWLGRGEAVLTGLHQQLVDPALRMAYGFGLPEMFAQYQVPHAATGGFPIDAMAKANARAMASLPAFRLGGTAEGRIGGGKPGIITTPGHLVGIPGQGQRIDSRILPDVEYLIRKYKLTVTAGYAASGHAPGGEHPLGLATDLVPGPGGNWNLVDRLAAYAEPVQNAPIDPWRWVGYNGDPDHGRGNHLHLSWQHGPGFPAQWVKVMGGKIANLVDKLTAKKLAGTPGDLQRMANAGIVPTAHKAAEFLKKKSSKLVGGALLGHTIKGGWQGINSAAEFIPFWNKINPFAKWAARAFSKIVPRESTWDPHAGGPGSSNPTHAGWYQFDSPTWSDFRPRGAPGWPEGPYNPALATAAAGQVAKREGRGGIMSRWAQTFSGWRKGGFVGGKSGLPAFAKGGGLPLGYTSKWLRRAGFHAHGPFRFEDFRRNAAFKRAEMSLREALGESGKDYANAMKDLDKRIQKLNVAQAERIETQIKNRIDKIRRHGVDPDERKHLDQLKKTLDDVQDQLNDVIRDRFKQAAKKLSTAEFHTAIAQSGLERLQLQQQLRGVQDTPGAGERQAQFIRRQVIPQLQRQEQQLQRQLRLARHLDNKQQARDIAQQLADIQNQILQAQLDAQNAIKENTASAADSLDEMKGSLGFEFGGQTFTDMLGVGVGT